MDGYNTYKSPLTDRYAGAEMSYNWSPQRKHFTWRRLWLALAESEKQLGLNISQEQIDQMKAHLDDIDFVLPQGQAHHPPRRNQLLRHRQHRNHSDARRSQTHPRQAPQSRRNPRRKRRKIQKHADSRLHSLSAGTAHDRRQTLRALSSGFHFRHRAD